MGSDWLANSHRKRQRHPRFVWMQWGLLIAVLLAGTELVRASNVVIDGAITYQTIAGFGADINHRSWTNEDLEPVIDAMVDQAGMTIFRIIYDNTDWEATNADPDPGVINWDYFNSVYTQTDFEKLWGLTAYLNQKGITNGVMFNFQGYGPAWMLESDGATLAPGYEESWAEMIGSLLIYARTNRALQFSVVGPDNEEDLNPFPQGIVMAQSQYVTALHDLAQLLNTNGLGDVRFVAPDLAFTTTDWWTAMMNDPVVNASIAHFGLHTYGEVTNCDDGGYSDGIEHYLQQSADPNADFWVTEYNISCAPCAEALGNDENWDYFRGTAEYLLAQLANGATAAIVWEGYDGYYLDNATPDNTATPNDYYTSYWGLFALDNVSNYPGPSPATYTPRQNFYTVAQISKFVRPGAQRIDVSVPLNPVLLAFYQANNQQLVLTGANSNSSPATITGTLTNLPPIASFELYYTDSTTNLFDSGQVDVINGSFNVTVPADCIFTLVSAASAPPVSVVITNPPNNSVFNAPINIPIQATATSASAIREVVFFSGTNQIGQSSASPYGIIWSNVAPGSYVLTAAATNSGGGFGVSPGVAVAVAGPVATITVSPANAPVAPGGSVQFQAVATDALGTALNPQPTFAWSVSGDGSIDTNGLFTAANQTNGTVTVYASHNAVVGTGTVTVLLTSSGLVAAYGFDEGSGNIVTDLSGNGNVGTISGGVIWTTGRFGGALQFDGTSGFITIPDSASLDLSNGMTLEVWVDPFSVDRWNPTLAKTGIGGIDCYILQASTSDTIPAMYCDGFNGNVDAPSAISPDDWTHLAATYDGTNAMIYVNGLSVVSAVEGSPITVSPGDLSIGFNNAVYFEGIMDEVRVYNRVLSADEIQADMNTPVAPAPEIVLTAPVSGTIYAAPATINLAAGVVTNTHNIVQVQFFSDTNLLGATALAPYTWTWTNVGPGSYSLGASVVYDYGSTVSSAPANIVVSNVPPQLAVGLVSNELVLSWDALLTNYIVESTTNLVAPAAWSPLTNVPQTAPPIPPGQQGIAVVPVDAQRFFRLRQL